MTHWPNDPILPSIGKSHCMHHLQPDTATLLDVCFMSPDGECWLCEEYLLDDEETACDLISEVLWQAGCFVSW